MMEMSLSILEKKDLNTNFHINIIFHKLQVKFRPLTCKNND